MDAVSSLLDGPRATAAFLLRSLLRPPWSMRIEDHAPLTIVVVVRGWAWLTPDGQAARRLGEGEIALLRGPRPYTVSDEPGRAPDVLVLEDQRCVAPDGSAYTAMSDIGVRTWGNDPDGPTVLLTGTYTSFGEVGSRLLDRIDETIVMAAVDETATLVNLLAAEIQRDVAGQHAVLDRLLDLLLVASLRGWFATSDRAPRWFAAQADPVVGSALRLIHEAPHNEWTLASLARASGSSRAVLARRFGLLVGQPPIAYLTQWRLAQAADLLRGSDLTLAAIADRVGYGSAYALSAAFRRERGISPRDFRARVLPREDEALGGDA